MGIVGGIVWERVEGDGVTGVTENDEREEKFELYEDTPIGMPKDIGTGGGLRVGAV